ncbi:MAG: patatin-like phospholipase family protein [Burkholderiales bacterium]|nr:patatin-like phospholipase family protein [Burkholderiales bacterium]
MRIPVRAWLLLVLLSGCAATPSSRQTPVEPVPAEVAAPLPRPPAPVVVPPARIALVLGGGAAKGFAHIGVIKALEAQGIRAEILAGTSVGSLVAALHGYGLDGFELQRLALEMKESMVSDWSIPDRGFLRGEALQDYVNRTVHNKTIEQLPRKVAIVSTDLRSGQEVVFERGDTGLAVRASSSVPGVFQPARISGREYVDGGLVSPVPVKVARRLGADFVIAVDISTRPGDRPVRDSVDMLLRTFVIMGNALADIELRDADVVIRPETSSLSMTDFESRHLAILEGERAALAVVAQIRQKLAAREQRLRERMSAAAGSTP